MIRRPPRSTRTDTLFPYTTLFRSPMQSEVGQNMITDPVLAAAHPVEGNWSIISVGNNCQFLEVESQGAATVLQIQYFRIGRHPLADAIKICICPLGNIIDVDGCLKSLHQIGRASCRERVCQYV